MFKLFEILNLKGHLFYILNLIKKFFLEIKFYIDKVFFWIIDNSTALFGVELKDRLIESIIQSFWDTMFMITVSPLLAFIFGLPLGVILVITKKGHIWQNKTINIILGSFVNIGRAIPFIILIILLIPFTKYIVGSSIGTKAAVVPLIIGSTPFIARLIEAALLEVEDGLIEAAQAIGANNFQIIYKVLLPEAKAGIISALTVTIITLVGYSAMAGAVGGGGLGDLAIRYGYQQFNFTVLIIAVIILLLMVEIIQNIGDFFINRISQKTN